REIRQVQFIADVRLAVGLLQLSEDLQIRFSQAERGLDGGLMNGDRLTGTQVVGLGIDLKGRVERVDEFPVQEQSLIERVFAFFVQFREARCDIEIAEQTRRLLNSNFGAQTFLQFCEAHQPDEKILVQLIGAYDVNNQIEFPHL